jgi:hypothetical protein
MEPTGATSGPIREIRPKFDVFCCYVAIEQFTDHHTPSLVDRSSNVTL